MKVIIAFSVISVVKYFSVSVSFFTGFFPFQFRFSFCKFFRFSFSFLLFVAITYGKVSLWLWKSLEPSGNLNAACLLANCSEDLRT